MFSKSGSGPTLHNNIFPSPVNGKISNILKKKKSYEITIQTDAGDKVESIPTGPDLLVKEGDILKIDQPLTNNPNVGGFGQTEGEIVLQSPARITGLLFILFTLILGQLFFVMKKKQFERVQLASGLFD